MEKKPRDYDNIHSSAGLGTRVSADIESNRCYELNIKPSGVPEGIYFQPKVGLDTNSCSTVAIHSSVLVWPSMSVE